MGEEVNFVRPSVDVAMKSIQPDSKTKIIGVVLIGIGKDGAEGIRHINIGGITIAQDEETSVIYGIPKAAYETGAVNWVLPPEEIYRRLVQLVTSF